MAVPSKRPTSTPVKYYLVAFNAISFVGWAYIFVLTIAHLFNLDGKSDEVSTVNADTASSIVARLISVSLTKASNVFSTSTVQSRLPVLLQPIYQRATTTFWRVGLITAFVQSLATLEVAHALLGYVRSPLPTTVAQVASRLFLVWGVTERFSKAQSSPLYTSMVLAWSLTEVIRYSFYGLNLLGRNPYSLLYLRYTTFFILYPIGASSEVSLIYATLPLNPSTASWLPTDFIRSLLFLIWWPGFYVLYTHMIGQRRKVLGGGKVKRN